MRLLRSSFSFVFGTAFGMYLAQNYSVPDIQRLISAGLVMAKHIEETYRKPKKKDFDDEKRSSD